MGKKGVTMELKTVTRRVWNEELGWYEDKEITTGKYKFTEEDKIQIVSEYLSSGRPASEIAEKYRISSRQIIFSWMDRYVNEREIVSLQEKAEDMSEKSPEERVKELESQVERLRKSLELEQLRSTAYSTMIDEAEKTFNIPIRKKSGTKQ